MLADGMKWFETGKVCLNCGDFLLKLIRIQFVVLLSHS